MVQSLKLVSFGDVALKQLRLFSFDVELLFVDPLVNDGDNTDSFVNDEIELESFGDFEGLVKLLDVEEVLSDSFDNGMSNENLSVVDVVKNFSFANGFLKENFR